MTRPASTLSLSSVTASMTRKPAASSACRASSSVIPATSGTTAVSFVGLTNSWTRSPSGITVPSPGSVRWTIPSWNRSFCSSTISYVRSRSGEVLDDHRDLLADVVGQPAARTGIVVGQGVEQQEATDAEGDEGEEGGEGVPARTRLLAVAGRDRDAARVLTGRRSAPLTSRNGPLDPGAHLRLRVVGAARHHGGCCAALPRRGGRPPTAARPVAHPSGSGAGPRAARRPSSNARPGPWTSSLATIASNGRGTSATSWLSGVG